MAGEGFRALAMKSFMRISMLQFSGGGALNPDGFSSGITTAPWPPAMQCDMVNNVRWLIVEYRADDSKPVLLALSPVFPILLVIQPMSGMVARSCLPMVMGLLSCESIIDNGSMSR